MDKKTLARLRGLGYEFDSAYDDMAEMIEKSRAEDVESKKRREEAKLKTEIEKQKNAIPNVLLDQQNKSEFGQEDFFITQSSNKKIQRYYQALKYDPDRREPNTITVYGMDCNACCVMYFLQSYGLIPPYMTRKEFEYLLTPLNPPDMVKPEDEDTSAYSANVLSKIATKRQLFVNDVLTKYLETDIFIGLFLDTSFFLRGISGYGAIFPHLYESSYLLNQIANRFYQLAQKTGYFAFREFHLPSSDIFKTNKQVIKNSYIKLTKGNIPKTYFDDGHTMFIGLDDNGYAPGHYCLIVGNHIISKKIDGIEYHLYPADDPFYGKTFIAVPNTINKETIKQLKVALHEIRKGASIKVITLNCAISYEKPSI